MNRGLLPLFALAVLVAPAAAMAADPPKNGGDPAAAQVLFYEARALMRQHKFAEACPKLEESLRLDAGLGTQFNLADCNDNLGKVATAWAGFLDVAAQAKATNQGEREKVARKRAAALEPRVPMLVVEVSGAAQGLEVKRDGVVVGAAAWGTPIPIDPGAHTISASAPGKQPWETTIMASEGLAVRVSVPSDLSAAPPVPSEAEAKPTIAVPAPAAATPPATPPVDTTQGFPVAVLDKPDIQRPIGWLIVGLGVVGASVGGGYGLSSLSKRNESRDHCVGNICDAAGVGLRDDAIRNGNVATVAIIAGGALVVAGIVVVLTAPTRSESRGIGGTLRAAPTVGAGGGGLMLQGSFQ